MKTQMRALGNVTYAGVDYVAGDEFTVDNVSDMRFLVDRNAAEPTSATKEDAGTAGTGEADKASSDTPTGEIPTTVIEGTNVHETNGGSAVVANQPSSGVIKRTGGARR